jgi:hypothetical protein
MPVPVPPAIPLVKATGLSSLGITSLPGLGGVAKAASSLLSFGGAFGGDDGPGYTEQLNNSLRTIREQTHTQTLAKAAAAVRAGKKHKIHPLTLLGAGNVPISHPVYEQKQNMGQNITNAVAQGTSAYFKGKEMDKLNQLTLERAQLENELLRSQITAISNPSNAGTAYSNDQRVLNIADENVHRKHNETGLTAGSENPPPAGKRFTVGNTPYGEIYITLPASGQADEYGEVYGAVKGLEYLAKRGYVHYSRGSYKAMKKLKDLLSSKKKVNSKPYNYNFNNRPEWMK